MTALPPCLVGRPDERGGAGGASAPGPGCLGGPGGKQKHRGGSRILSVGDPGF